MKRLMPLLCCLCILLCAAVAAAAPTEKTLVANKSEAGYIRSACEIQSQIYLLSDKGVYQ